MPCFFEFILFYLSQQRSCLLLTQTIISSISVAAIFDNEEVGSGTKQGADSTFLKDVLERINDSLGRTREQYLMAVVSSFMISADNAHAVS